MKIVLCLVALVLTGCAEDQRNQVIRGFPSGVLSVDTGEETVEIAVEIAETEEQRATGLMGVEELPDGSGMVFIFPEVHQGPFYMKDTPIPLDIAFWDEQGRIVDILHMTPCEKEPCTLYRPDAPYIGAVEMASGSMKNLGIEEGATVELARTSPT